MGQKSTSKKLLGNSLLYTISGLLSKCLSFFLLPIYTRILSTSDYGIQNLIFGFNSVMCYVILLCLDSAAIKFYTDYKDDRKKLKRFYGTGIVIISSTSVISLTICYLARDYLVRTVFEGVEFFPYVVIGLGILVLEAFYTLHRRVLEAQQNGKKVAIISMVMVLMTTAITLLLVGVFKKGAIGLLLSSLFVYMMAVVFVIIDAKCYDMVTLCFDKKLAKSMLKYSIPLLPHQVSGYLATFISRVLLNLSGNLGVVGLFSVASQFSSVIDTFQDSVSRAYRPWLFERLGKFEEKSKREVSELSVLLISFYTLVYGAIGLFGLELVVVMTSSSYHEAWKIIPILVIGYSIKSIYYFYVAQCLYYPNTSSKVFIASISGSLANIFFAAMMVPSLEMYGSAIAYCLSHFVCTIIVVFLNRTNQDIGYNLWKLVGTIVIALAFIAIGIAPGYLYFGSQFSWSYIGYKLLISLGYICYLYFSNKKVIKKHLNGRSILRVIRPWK